MADVFDAFRESQRESFAKLRQRPPVLITGIVSDNGVYAMQPTKADPITLRGSFDAWRIEGGPLETVRSLRIECHVQSEQLERLTESMPVNAIVQIRARLGSDHALLEEVVEPIAQDADLQQHLEELLNPHTIEDAFFGTFTCTRDVFAYTTQFQWCDDEIELELLPDEPLDMDSAIKAAKTLWSAMSDWDKRIVDYAVTELLPLKHDCWRQTDEPAMSAHEFSSQLQLSSLSVGQNGSFTFHFDCGDLFGDHTIEVYGSLKEGLQGTGICG